MDGFQNWNTIIDVLWNSGEFIVRWPFINKSTVFKFEALKISWTSPISEWNESNALSIVSVCVWFRWKLHGLGGIHEKSWFDVGYCGLLGTINGSYGIRLQFHSCWRLSTNTHWIKVIGSFTYKQPFKLEECHWRNVKILLKLEYRYRVINCDARENVSSPNYGWLGFNDCLQCRLSNSISFLSLSLDISLSLHYTNRE